MDDPRYVTNWRDGCNRKATVCSHVVQIPFPSQCGSCVDFLADALAS
jgi:hypothetical protein